MLLLVFLSGAFPMAACTADAHTGHADHVVTLQQDAMNHDVTCLRECDAQISAVIYAASSVGVIQQAPTKSKHSNSGLAAENEHVLSRSLSDHPPLREFPNLIIPTSLFAQATLLLE